MRGSQTGKNKCICCGVTKNEYFPVRKGGGRNQYFNEITVAGQACALSDHSNLLSAFHKSLRSFVNTREASKRCEIFLLRKITTFFCRFSLLEHRFLTWLSVGGTLHSSPSALKKKLKQISSFHFTTPRAGNSTVSSPVSSPFPRFLLFSCNKYEFPVLYFTTSDPLSDPCSLCPDLSFLQLTFPERCRYPFTPSCPNPPLLCSFP